MSNKLYWIWLSLAVTAGTETFKKLIGSYSDAEEIFRLDEAELERVLGKRARNIKALANKSLKIAEDILNFCESKNVGIILYSDKEYPEALREISTPPVLLYYRGILPDFNSECFVSVVGTRRLSPYGRRNAFSIAYDLGTCGATVVSGLAKGIDGVAHAGALASGAKTIAFLGSGINICYPDEHITLAREIVKSGCILTEYPPNTKPYKNNFPKRNRLIAAVSCATVIIEGRERSGAGISASLAKDFGKKVYALPGNVDSANSAASNNCIKDGATLITDAYNVIEDFEFKYPGKLYLSKAKAKIEADMDKALSRYKISCVSSADDIFRPSRRAKSNSRIKPEAPNEAPASTDNGREAYDPEAEYRKISEVGITGDAMKLYMKIPYESSCSIDDLVDETFGISDVLINLQKLEILGFVTLVSGERVKRKKN